MSRSALFLLLALLPGWSAAVLADEVSICYNYDCAVSASVIFNDGQLLKVKSLFNRVADAVAERNAIASAIGLFETFAGEQTPTRNDKGGNVNDDGVDGRMDCLDHSHNTTAYLHLLENHGWLKFHRVLEPVERAPLVVDVHWAAHIAEIRSGQEYAVDSWFFDNGKPAAIFTLAQWLHGASPHE